VTGEISLLTIIAVAVTVMAVAQLLSLRHIMKMAERASTAIAELQRDLAPILKNAHEASEAAARVAALAEENLARLDAVVRTTTVRVEEMVDVAHSVVTGPVRHGVALIAGLKAAWDLFTSGRQTRDGQADHEEPGASAGRAR
jgi:uncharacterized protein YoxC